MRCRDCGVPIEQRAEKAMASGEHAIVWASDETWICPVTTNEHVPTETPAHWVVIERRTWGGDEMSDLVIGPYESAGAATDALESVLVDSICTDTKRAYSVEDNVYATSEPDPEGQRLYIDPADPHDHGPDHVPAPANDAEDVILCILCRHLPAGQAHNGDHIVPGEKA